MPSTILVAALPLAGVLNGAVLQFAFGRNLEARKQLNLKRAEAYVDFFGALSGLAQSHSKENLQLAASAKTRVCMYGSEEVVGCLGQFERSGANASTGPGRRALIALLQAMRQDVSSGNRPLGGEDLAIILFSEDVS